MEDHKFYVLHSANIVRDTLKSFQPRQHFAQWVSLGLVYPCPTCASLHLPNVLNYHDQGEPNPQVSTSGTRSLQKDLASNSSFIFLKFMFIFI